MTAGTKLNDTYTLIEEIGSGGGGVVYRAYHERLHTDVVVKKIRENVRGILESRAEADILKNIKHTCLPRVYDFLEIDNEIYTVMDYIPGKSLDKALLEAGRFPQKQVLKWAEELAEALEYLHSRKPPVIHSDIKPANIMLTPEGKICLIDFNVSLAFDSGRKTSAGISGGYSPPEQYADLAGYRRFAEKSAGRQTAVQETRTLAGGGETVPMPVQTGRTSPENVAAVSAAAEVGGPVQTETARTIKTVVGRGVDERSDIYSLGATLYHLLTGIRPGNNFEEIVPIDQCGAEFGEGLVHILKKMMEFDPDDRYQNGGELLHALQHIYELDTEYRDYRRTERNRKLLTAALCLSGAVLLGGGWIVRQRELDTDYNRIIAQAEECMASGDLDAASGALQTAMDIRPGRMEAYADEVLRLYRLGDYDGCIRYGADILMNPAYEVKDEKDQNTLGDIYYVLGNCYLENEDYSNAELNLNQAIAQYDQNSLYHRDYAIALAKQGKVQKAEAVLETAVALGLGEDSVYMVQGEISFAKGEYTKAEEQLLRAVSAAEEESLRKRAVLLCGRVYRELGSDEIDREIELLEREEGRFSTTVSAMNISERLADAYVRKAESDETVRQEYYEKALERFYALYEKGYATRQMMENIAILYEQLNEYEKAADMLAQMLGKYPDSYVCYKRLAYLEADIQQHKENADRDYEKMKEYYDRAKELYSDQDQDQEMEMLDHMIQDLRDGNWL